MSYIANNLLNNEKIIFETKLHWVIFMTPLISFIIALALFIFGPYSDFTNITVFNLPPAYKILGLLALLYAVYGAILNYLHFCLVEYAITNQRVLIKHGIIYRTIEVIILEKIESTMVNQSILARILKYGTIIILGTGGSRDVMVDAEKPIVFRNILEQQIENHTSHGNHE